MGASNCMGGLGGSAMSGAFLATGGFSSVGVFCLAAVGISSMVMSLAIRGPDEGIA